jgi:branched-subunit amino acid ABC-type transport system permease component
VYAIAAMGLVVTYTTTGVFNFAHGAIGMIGAYVFYSLRVDAGVPTAFAVAIVVLAIAPLMGVIVDRVLVRRLSSGNPAASIVLSLGLLVALQGGASAVYGANTKPFSPLFSRDTAIRVADVNVSVEQLIVLAIALASAAALYLFLTRTRLGLATRAVAGDPELTALVGVDPDAVRTLSWMLGCSFATLAGILLSPIIGLDSLVLTLLVVQAFGAAIVGKLRNLPLTNIGAYGIAIVAALATKVVATQPAWRGLPAAMPFIFLFVVLVASRKGSFGGLQEVAVAGFRGASRLPRAQLGGFAIVAAAVPFIVADRYTITATAAAAYVLLFASLGLLVGVSRQVSLCHAAFVALGATNLSHLLSAGLPYPIALLLAGLLVVPIGAFVAIPAIRLSGLFLALATFGFGIVAESLLFRTSWAFGDRGTVSVARPAGFTTDRSFYFFVLAVVVLGILVLELIKVTRLGRVLRALADSSVAVQAIGINPIATRVMTFCVSSFMAAVTGGLLGSLSRNVTLTSFNSFLSLTWLAVLVTAGASTLGGSVLASLLLIAAPAVVTDRTFIEWQPVAFGIGAMVFARQANGIAGLFASRRRALGPIAEDSRGRLDRTRHRERLETAAAGRPL